MGTDLECDWRIHPGQVLVTEALCHWELWLLGWGEHPPQPHFVTWAEEFVWLVIFNLTPLLWPHVLLCQRAVLFSVWTAFPSSQNNMKIPLKSIHSSVFVTFCEVILFPHLNVHQFLFSCGQQLQLHPPLWSLMPSLLLCLYEEHQSAQPYQELLHSRVAHTLCFSGISYFHKRRISRPNKGRLKTERESSCHDS